METQDITNPTICGAKFRAGHKATVVGVLGDRAPAVYSRGSTFYNTDRWTLRGFVYEMCQWAKKNPQCIPTPGVIRTWVQTANKAKIPQREIVIANTPDKLKVRTAMALMGGAYHEAFHTYYSCLRPLQLEEMVKMIIPRWALVPDWSRFYEMLQDWNNLVEDIRIERLGRQDFPGCEVKMHDLQDFILKMEKDSDTSGGRSHGNKPRGPMSLIIGTFRDIGLGYNTTTQQEALATYRAEDAKAVEFVIGQGQGNPGPLTALLKESIDLPQEDDIGCVRIAMEVVSILWKETKEQDPANDPDNKEHQPGASERPQCPKCGAPGSKLVIRPIAAADGKKVKGKGMLTCSSCGHQEEVSLKPSDKGKGKPSDPKDQPKFEGFDSPEKEGSTPGQGEDPEEGGAGEDPEFGESEGAGSGDPESDGSGGESGDSSQGAGDENSPGEAEGDGEDGSGESDGDPGQDRDTGQEGSPGASAPGGCPEVNSGSPKDPGDEARDEGYNLGTNEANTDANAGASSSFGGGGHRGEQGPIQGNDWSVLTTAALRDPRNHKILDNSTALASAVGAENKAAIKAEGGVKRGEALWAPFDPLKDKVALVEPSRRGKEVDQIQADKIGASVRSEASYLRSRLRKVVQAMEMTSTIHGMPKGRRLSGRFLVDSKASIRCGVMPRRAYKQNDEQRDTSLSAAIVLDESSSMSGLLRQATQILYAITEPLDALGCPVQVSGFRDGCGGWGYPTKNQEFHRKTPIEHDIFKAFHEPLRSIRWRFANTRASGGTPMADGVQFGLDALSARTEGHRILFVITDGQPNAGHMPIIRRQLRLAKAAGIHVVGVGIGHGAEYVSKVFPDAVWTPAVADMPAALITKLNQIIDMTNSKRGVWYAG